MSKSQIEHLIAMSAAAYVEHVDQTVRETGRRDPDWVVLTDPRVAPKTMIALKAISADLNAQFAMGKERGEDTNPETAEAYRAWKLRAYGFQRHLRWLQAQVQIACMPNNQMIGAVWAHRNAAEAAGVEPEPHDLALWSTIETPFSSVGDDDDTSGLTG